MSTLVLSSVDEGQEAVAVEAVLVEPVRRPVRGGDHHEAALEQAFEQPAQDHGVGDVDDVELVEAEQPVAPGDVGRQGLQGILGRTGLAQVVQAMLHLEHELVEVDAAVRHPGHGVGEQVHQHGLAAPDATMEVDALGRPHGLRLAAEAQAGEKAAAAGGGCRFRLELACQPVEACRRRLLHGIEADLACVDQGAVALERHDGPGQ